MIKKFWYSVVATAERYRELQEQKPYINILMLVEIILALAAGVAVLDFQNLAFLTFLSIPVLFLLLRLQNDE